MLQPRPDSLTNPHAAANLARCGILLAVAFALASCRPPASSESEDSGGGDAEVVDSGMDSDAATADASAAPTAAAGADDAPIPLFDGESLGSWQPIEAYPGGGDIRVEDGALIIGQGETLTGVRWVEDESDETYSLPLLNYEIALEAKRIAGVDFFCGLTFPIGDLETCSTLVVGGWGGGVVGISSIDDLDAANNDTTSYQSFEADRWYRIRLQVQENRLKGWIDDKLVINSVTRARKLGMRLGDIVDSKPLGLSTYQTTGAIRNITIRTLADEEIDNSEF